MLIRLTVLFLVPMIIMTTSSALAEISDKSDIIDPPGEDWCYSHQIYEKNNNIEKSDKYCPQVGICDDPNERNLWTPADDDTIKVFRMFFNIFTYDAGTDSAISVADLQAAVIALNDLYLGSRIQFVYDYRYIADSRYRDMEGYDITVEAKALHALDPGIQCNVYVTNMKFGSGDASFATFPFDPNCVKAQGGIVMNLLHMPPYNYSYLAHEMGHNLGLWHTHHGVIEVELCGPCYESPLMGDGDITGDFCSDTYPTPVVWNCEPTNFGTDPCTFNSWAPGEPHNIMSYNWWQCIYNFSQQQSARMHCWSSGTLDGWLAVVDIQTDMIEGPAPLDIDLTAISDETVQDWNWDLGDGTSADLQNLTHTFEKPGLYDISVTVQTPEGEFSRIRRELIWAQGDTIKIPDMVGNMEQSTRFDVFAANSLPLNEIWIPFTWAGPLDMQFDSATTTGLRTEFMPYQQLVSYSPINERATFMCRTIRPNGIDELPADTGAVLSLWFTCLSGASSDSSQISLTSYSGYLPKLVARRAVIDPVLEGGEFILCIAGDVNGSGAGTYIDDLVFMVDFMFNDGLPPLVPMTADVNGSGLLDIADLVYVVDYMFMDGPEPVCTM